MVPPEKSKFCLMAEDNFVDEQSCSGSEIYSSVTSKDVVTVRSVFKFRAESEASIVDAPSFHNNHGERI